MALSSNEIKRIKKRSGSSMNVSSSALIAKDDRKRGQSSTIGPKRK